MRRDGKFESNAGTVRRGLGCLEPNRISWNRAGSCRLTASRDSSGVGVCPPSRGAGATTILDTNTLNLSVADGIAFPPIAQLI